MEKETKNRCFGNGPGKEFYAEYHDHEWGIPTHEETQLFEMLVLEGAQAGLSWETVLRKREAYRRLFHNFNPSAVSKMSDKKLEELLDDSSIIRNRLKVFGARKNAKVFLKIQEEFGSFDRYVWGFVNNQPIINHWKTYKEIPSRTEESDLLSKELKKRGMVFVGSTIIYAYMQSTGMVNDHLVDCHARLSSSV